jgi:hypothetical protein
MLIPLLRLTTRRGRPYPIGTDNLYLSIFALDLAGNYLDLYNRHAWFDLIPHFHGTGAASLVVADLLDQPLLSAVGVTQILHIGLEAQEYYSDVLFDLPTSGGPGTLSTTCWPARPAHWRMRASPASVGDDPSSAVSTARPRGESR